jgi:hypothetical protein
MQSALKQFMALWMKMATADNEGSAEIDEVHLRCTSRAVKYLQDELYHLSTPRRSQGYLAFMQTLRDAII